MKSAMDSAEFKFLGQVHTWCASGSRVTLCFIVAQGDLDSGGNSKMIYNYAKL